MKILEHTEEWRGTYQSIEWRINRNMRDNLPGGYPLWWCWYIALREASMPQEIFDTLWLPPDQDSWGVSYDYYDCPLIQAIEFHCGCNYYQKKGGFDGMKRLVEVGCSYDHLWDIDRPMDNFEQIQRDLIRGIESVRVAIPELKWWCSWNGGYYDLSEGQIGESGEFVSNEAMKAEEERKREAVRHEEEQAE